MTRPFATIGFSFAAALVAASLLSLNGSIAMAVVCGLCFFVLLAVRPTLRMGRAGRQCLLAALLAAAAAFSLYGCFEVFRYRPAVALEGGTARVRLQITELPQNRGTVDICEVQVMEDAAVSGLSGAAVLPKGSRMIALVDAELDAEAFDILEGEVELSRLEDTLNGEARNSFKAKGQYLRASFTGWGGEGIAVEEPDRLPLYGAVIALRETARDQVMYRLPGDTGALVCSVAFGYREDLSDQIQDDFRAAGMSHLVAVSGLNVSLLAQVLLWLLKRLRVPRRLSALAAAASVFFFMALSGFPASAVRAGIMSILYFLGLAVGREADSLNSLGFSLLVMTAGNPYAVNDVGLLLSAGATLGLLTLGPRFQAVLAEPLRKRTDALRLLARPVTAVTASMAAILPTLPVMVLVFRDVSLVAPLSNLLTVAPAMVLMMTGCGAVACLLVPGLSFLAGGLLLAAGGLSRYLMGVAGGLASFPFATVRLDEAYSAVWVLGALLLLLAGYALLGKNGLRRMAPVTLCIFMAGMLFHTFLTAGATSVTSLPVGDGTALLFRRNGCAGAVLAGGDDDIPGMMSWELSQKGIRRLDFLILPDLNEACLFRLQDLIQEVEVDCVITGNDGEYRRAVESLVGGEKRVSLTDGAVRFWDDGRVQMEEDGWLRLYLGDTSLLFCPAHGDAAMLSADRRCANYVIFTEAPPRHVTALTAQGGVLGCSEERVSYVTKALPWGAYPLGMTGTDGEICMWTRGRGDVSFV